MQLESGVEKFYLISFLNKRNRIIELGLSPALTLPISFFFVPGQKTYYGVGTRPNLDVVTSAESKVFGQNRLN